MNAPRSGGALRSLVTVLELDHVFCMVTEPAQAARRLEDQGWVLDAGQAHPGQGTRNRRLAWHDQFFELLWVTDAAEARANPLRLDRRAEWTTTGASPVGLAFRGRIDPAQHDEFWLYDALGPNIWIHRDDERSPQRPLVFVLETAFDDMQQRRPRVWTPDSVTHRCCGELREVRVHGPSPPSLPPYAGPPIVHLLGAHRLELVVEVHGTARPVTDNLAIRW
jgi:glyoxalase-like protein